jgi:hypothetical protein
MLEHEFIQAENVPLANIYVSHSLLCFCTP